MVCDHTISRIIHTVGYHRYYLWNITTHLTLLSLSFRFCYDILFVDYVPLHYVFLAQMVFQSACVLVGEWLIGLGARSVSTLGIRITYMYTFNSFG